MSDKRHGPPMPLNEAAIAAQKRHAKVTTDIELRMRAVALEMEIEMRRWHDEMAAAMPEMFDDTKDADYHISDDGLTFCEVLNDGAPQAKQPSWAIDLAASMTEGNA